MNYSSILIAFQPETMAATLEAVKAPPAVEGVPVDEEHSGGVAVFEGESAGDEVSTFDAIRHLEGVMDVSLINHYFADEMAAGEEPTKSE